MLYGRWYFVDNFKTNFSGRKAILFTYTASASINTHAGCLAEISVSDKAAHSIALILFLNISVNK